MYTGFNSLAKVMTKCWSTYSFFGIHNLYFLTEHIKSAIFTKKIWTDSKETTLLSLESTDAKETTLEYKRAFLIKNVDFGKRFVRKFEKSKFKSPNSLFESGRCISNQWWMLETKCVDDNNKMLLTVLTIFTFFLH